MEFWYSTKLSLKAALLLPLSAIVFIVVLFKQRLRRKSSYTKPVIVVGNITVGGTGKTPTIIWLVNWLKSEGYRPAVVSRGYGAKPSRGFPVILEQSDSTSEAGDEPKLIHQKTNVPVVIDPNRNRAVEFLCQTQANSIDVIVSDDGMQHLAMYRDLEILMVDGLRGLGNGHLIPAGPLREPKSKVDKVDVILTKQGRFEANVPSEPAQFNLGVPVNIKGQKLTSEEVVVCSGIGNFESFIETAKSIGLTVAKCIEFKDHQVISETVLADKRLPIVVTEKDFIKLSDPPEHVYQLPFSLTYSDAIKTKLLNAIKKVIDEKSNHHSSAL